MKLVNSAELKSLLPSVTALAKAAGEEILKFYQVQNLGIATKADATPVTSADIAAHECITARLKEITPHIPVLSEEGALLPFATRETWQQYWLVDPLDGTKGFLAGNGEFTVNIALIQNNKPILGVIYVPVSEKCYFAAQDFGAYKQEPGQSPQPIVTRAYAGDTLTVLTSRVHGERTLQNLLQHLGDYERVRLNSSLKFCFLADSGADFYPRLSQISEWDVAAGQCIVEQAGGVVYALDFTPLRYNTKDSIHYNGFIVVGDPHHNWQVLQEFF